MASAREAVTPVEVAPGCWTDDTRPPVPRPSGPIDFSARERHFVDHLAPVWHEIPADMRGGFYTEPDVVDHAQALGIHADIGWPLMGRDRGPVVVASWGDLRVVSRLRRPVVLAEHGAGQSYGNRHHSYVGGEGREKVKLFIVPNEAAAERNRRYYPFVPNAVVGSPRLDVLKRIARVDRRPRVAISFHWRADISGRPEAGSAVDEYLDVLPAVASRLRREGVDLFGHGHPRILDELIPVYSRAGVPTIRLFDDVVRFADVFAVDNSSTLFEFAALGRPVVVLNSSRYRRSVDYGLRFWTEASIGINVDRSDDLAAALLLALRDPEPVRRSRLESVARVYPVTDGTSATRAAAAVVALLKKACIVCGKPDHSCGPTTTTVPVDEMRSAMPKKGPLKRYPNPDRPGAFIKADEATARRLGLVPGPVEPTTIVSVSGGSAVTAPPEGALQRGGVTHRARAKATGGSPVEETPTPEPTEATAPDASVTDDPKDKARPAPSSRRRRKVQ